MRVISPRAVSGALTVSMSAPPWENCSAEFDSTSNAYDSTGGERVPGRAVWMRGGSYAPLRIGLPRLQEALLLSLVDYAEGEVLCPHCGSREIEQCWSAFSAFTSKKSA